MNSSLQISTCPRVSFPFVPKHDERGGSCFSSFAPLVFMGAWGGGSGGGGWGRKPSFSRALPALLAGTVNENTCLQLVGPGDRLGSLHAVR